jgi:hypothetical protein
VEERAVTVVERCEGAAEDGDAFVAGHTGSVAVRPRICVDAERAAVAGAAVARQSLSRGVAAVRPPFL